MQFTQGRKKKKELRKPYLSPLNAFSGVFSSLSSAFSSPRVYFAPLQSPAPRTKMISLVNGSSILFRAQIQSPIKFWLKNSSSATRCSSLEPPNVAQLAETARITLSLKEIQDFAPKINKVVDWFGQLQGVDLESVEPSLRAVADAGTEPREDVPDTFENRDALLAEIPSFTEPYIKVPKVLNKD